MSAFLKFNQFVEDVAEKVHNLAADTIKVLLTNVAPVATNAVKADITEIAAGNGYTAGGTASAQVSSAQTSGTYKLVLSDVLFTAVGGPIATFRYAVFYNDTPVAPADPLIGYYDYGAAVIITDGNSFLVDVDAVNGTLTLA